jgi:hypothetical protein
LRVGLLVQWLPREAGIEIGGKIGNQAAAEVLSDAGARELRDYMDSLAAMSSLT